MLTLNQLDMSQKQALECALRKFIYPGVEVAPDTFIAAVSDDGCALTLSNDKEYFLWEADKNTLRYWPEEMESDYDMVDVEVYPDEDFLEGLIIYGS